MEKQGHIKNRLYLQTSLFNQYAVPQAEGSQDTNAWLKLQIIFLFLQTLGCFQCQVAAVSLHLSSPVMGQSEGFIKQIMAFPDKLMQSQTLLFSDAGGFYSTALFVQG